MKGVFCLTNQTGTTVDLRSEAQTRYPNWSNRLLVSESEITLNGTGGSFALPNYVFSSVLEAITLKYTNGIRTQSAQAGGAYVINGTYQVWRPSTSPNLIMNDADLLTAILGLLATVRGAKEFYDEVQSTLPGPLTRGKIQNHAVFWEGVMSNWDGLTSVTIDPTLDVVGQEREARASNLKLDGLIGTLDEDQLARIRRNRQIIEEKKLRVNDLVVELAESYALDGDIGTMLDGVTGSGKTSTYRMVADMIHLPIYQYNFSRNVEEEHFIGREVIQNGSTVFLLGEFTKAFKYGGLFIAEEVNRVGADVLAKLNESLDDSGRLVTPYEVIYRHPAFRFGMTLNPGYAGTKPLDISLVRRMGMRIVFETMSSSDMEKLVMESVPDLSKDIVVTMVKVAKEIEKKYKEERIPDAAISGDHIVKWAKRYRRNPNWMTSAARTIVSLSCMDEEVNKEVMEAIIQKYDGSAV